MSRTYCDRRDGGRAARRGTVIVVVLVVVTMISLGSYALVESMYVQHKAARLHGDRLQREQALASGAERLAALADLPPGELQRLGGLHDNPVWFHDIPLLPVDGNADVAALEQIHLSVLAPPTENSDEQAERYGTENESSRLNLAAVWQWELQRPGTGRAALLQLPGMTDAAADSILDWLDPDTHPRPLGAENDYYAGLESPYAAGNGVPTDLHELLLVSNVTPHLLFGQRELPRAGDRSDGTASVEPGHSTLRPWSSLLTLWSGERQSRPDGRPRIDLNVPDLARLQQQLAEVLDARLAQFIVAYRQFGPYSGAQAGEDAGGLTANVSAPARFSFATPLDLVAAKVAVPTSGGAAPKVFASPLGADQAQGGEMLLSLLDQATIGPELVQHGRINVNLAPAEVLRAVPGLNAGHVQTILSARGDVRSAANPQRRHAVWPWVEGLLDLETMKRLMPFLTAGGDVHRARVVARDSRGRQVAAADVVVDATGIPARIRSYRTDWTSADEDADIATGRRRSAPSRHPAAASIQR